MDDSMSSTNYMSQQSISSNSCEESGWTYYFEDFLANNDYDNNMDDSQEEQQTSLFSSSAYQNSSMVSDAAMRKLSDSKLIAKHKKFYAKKFVDEELEDTAISPSHSPKVNDLNHLYMKSKELVTQDVGQAYNSNNFQRYQMKDKCISFPREEGQASQHAGERNDMGFLETQLRRKGLCLVPMSMLLNHLG